MKIQGYLSIVGSCLLMFPTGIHWYWGNLATYTSSYMHVNNPTMQGTNTTWVLSLFHTCRTASLIIGGMMIACIGKRATTLIGITIFNLGLFASHFAVQQSMILLNLTLGVLCGLGAGFAYSATLHYPIEWASKNAGLVVSLVQSSYNIGAVVLNTVLTMYINPENKSPDENVKKYAYFSETDVINRVPSTFGLLFVISVILQISGLCMLRENRFKESEKQAINDQQKSNGVSPIQTMSGNSPEAPSPENKATMSHIFKTFPFYLLLTVYFLGEFPYLTVTNYYKIFGLLRLKDDHYFAGLGVVILVTTAIAKMSFGFIADIVSFKTTQVALYSLMVISCSFIYVMPFISPWSYLITVVMMACSSSIPIVASTVGVVRLYGQQNVAFNTGLVNVSSTIMDILAPFFIDFIMEAGGWEELFYTAAGCALICFFLMVMFLPRI